MARKSTGLPKSTEADRVSFLDSSTSLNKGAGIQAGLGVPFEGAEIFSREMSSWNPGQASADAALIPHKYTLDSRSLNIAQNDAYISGGLNFFKDNLIGTQYNLVAKPKYKILGKTEEWAQAFTEEVEAKFSLWANSPRNHVDAAGINDLTKLLRLAVAMWLTHGEVLAVVEYKRKSGQRSFGTCVQLVDPLRLQNPPGVMESKYMVGGIRKDQYGNPITYYIRNHHPLEIGWQNDYNFKAVSARKPWGRPMVLHYFEQERVAQSRGVSIMTSMLKELNVTKKFRDIVLQNAIVRATYAAFIKTEVPVGEEIYEAMGAGNLGKSHDVTQRYGDYLGLLSEWVNANPNSHSIDGVKLPVLFPNTSVEMVSPGDGGPMGTDFETSLLRYIAAGLNISYEQLSKDYSQSTYSSARAAMNESWKSLMAKKAVFFDKFATQIYSLWLEEAIANDFIESLPSSEMPPNVLYQGINLEALTNCWWIGAGRGQIDELKETQAADLRQKAGFTTLEYECKMQGKDYREVIEQRARERKMLKEHDLLPPEENPNMMNSVRGKAGQTEANEVSDAEE
jgi:lambda family phage portal protein